MLFADKISLVAFLRAKFSAVLFDASLYLKRFIAIGANYSYPSMGVLTFFRTKAGKERKMFSYGKMISTIGTDFFNFAAFPIRIVFSNVVFIKALAGTKFGRIVSISRDKLFVANRANTRFDCSLRFIFTFVRTKIADLRWFSIKRFSTNLTVLFNHFITLKGASRFTGQYCCLVNTGETGCV
jgi:hypothetical protein